MKKTLLLLAMATAILMVGGGCSKQDTNDQTSAGDNTATTVADGTADWKTFLGSQFQFSFKYPRDWFITKGSSIESQPEAVFISEVKLEEGGEDLGNLSIVVNKSSLEKNIRKNLISREEITFADRPATKIKFTGDWGPAMISILVPYDKYTFVISYDPEDKNYSSIEKILNSFSFETTAQSDLETYSSEKYSFKYSNGYKIDDSNEYVLYLTKEKNRKLVIFQAKEGHYGEGGIQLGAPQEQIDQEVPKEQLTVGSGENEYDIWIYYSKDDATAEGELDAIFNSITVK